MFLADLASKPSGYRGHSLDRPESVSKLLKDVRNAVEIADNHCGDTVSGLQELQGRLLSKISSILSKCCTKCGVFEKRFVSSPISLEICWNSIIFAGSAYQRHSGVREMDDVLDSVRTLLILWESSGSDARLLVPVLLSTQNRFHLLVTESVDERSVDFVQKSEKIQFFRVENKAFLVGPSNTQPPRKRHWRLVGVCEIRVIQPGKTLIFPKKIRKKL